MFCLCLCALVSPMPLGHYKITAVSNAGIAFADGFCTPSLSPPQCLHLAYFHMIKVIPEQFQSPFSKAYQICASGPVLKRGNRHIFCEGDVKTALLPCVCQMGDRIGSSTWTKWKMCHIVSKLCARCPGFFLVSLPYPLGSLAGALC